jgi:hypothetical protein
MINDNPVWEKYYHDNGNIYAHVTYDKNVDWSEVKVKEVIEYKDVNGKDLDKSKLEGKNYWNDNIVNILDLNYR